MPRTGRPKLDEADKKGGIFNFRISEDERVQIEAAAAKAGKRASAWVREIVLAKAGKRG